MARKFAKESLERLLIESGRITRDDLKNALDEQAKTGKRFEEILVKKNKISEEEMLGILGGSLGIKHVELEKISIDADIAKSIPYALANKYNLIPLNIKKDKIVVAMSNPLNLFAIDDVKFATGYEVEPVIASKAEIKKQLDKIYIKQSAEKAAEDLKMEFTGMRKDAADLEDKNAINNAPAVRLVNSIISQAIKDRASDIHIEPFEKYVKIRFRIDGELREVMRVAKNVQSAVITRIKIMSSLNIAERRIPQDGRIMLNIDGKDMDVRISILPTVFGEKAVMRLLNRTNFLVPKTNLGFSDDDLKKVESMIKRPYGILLITGPTGSGKSTTMYALINELNTVGRNIVTIEDPVEYMMEGINQINVNTKAGLTFASGLRSILRQDPDVIMIGEIRDNETAEIAIRAAITGHLVLATLHTNDAPSSVTRLIDMGIQSFLVSSSLIGIIAQRLVRKICNNCKYEYEANETEKRVLGVDAGEKLMLHRGKGCGICNHTGYYQRCGVFEIMEFTRIQRNAIDTGKSLDDLRNISIDAGMKTLFKSCRRLVLSGITTIDELLKTTYINE